MTYPEIEPLPCPLRCHPSMLAPQSFLLLCGPYWWWKHPIGPSKGGGYSSVCIVFFGFLRCAEFTISSLEVYDPNQQLSFSDIILFHPPKVTTVTMSIKCSKTD
jgi:hypothetical protein